MRAPSESGRALQVRAGAPGESGRGRQVRAGAPGESGRGRQVRAGAPSEIIKGIQWYEPRLKGICRQQSRRTRMDRAGNGTLRIKSVHETGGNVTDRQSERQSETEKERGRRRPAGLRGWRRRRTRRRRRRGQLMLGSLWRLVTSRQAGGRQSDSIDARSSRKHKQYQHRGGPEGEDICHGPSRGILQRKARPLVWRQLAGRTGSD